ncbi:hypothetical protein ACT5E2_00490 [Limosilactobacillus mucosae]
MNPFNPTFGDVPKILIDNDPKTTDHRPKYKPDRIPGRAPVFSL